MDLLLEMKTSEVAAWMHSKIALLKVSQNPKSYLEPNQLSMIELLYENN